MTCDVWQAALSAISDGEDPGVEQRLLDGHVASCLGCQAFRDALGPMGLLHDVTAMPDLSHRIVKAHAVADRARVWWVIRLLLFAAAAFVIFDASHEVFFGAHGESAHAAKHLGAFTFAYGVGLAVVAVRPARARTMLPVTFVLGSALLITAVLDVVDHQTPLVGETVHIPELASVLLVWMLVLPAGGRRSFRRMRRPLRPTPAPRLVAVDALVAAGDPTGRPTDRAVSPHTPDRSTG